MEKKMSNEISLICESCQKEVESEKQLIIICLKKVDQIDQEILRLSKAEELVHYENLKKQGVELQKKLSDLQEEWTREKARIQALYTQENAARKRRIQQLERIEKNRDGVIKRQEEVNAFVSSFQMTKAEAFLQKADNGKARQANY